VPTTHGLSAGSYRLNHATKQQEMQARELTPEEVSEGNRGISERQLTATEVQALVRKMDTSKKKWKFLKQQGKKAEYEEDTQEGAMRCCTSTTQVFLICTRRTGSDSTFFEMLQLKRKIERGEISAEEASRIVGQQLFNRFVPHAIDSNAPAPAPRMSYEDFYRQSQE
jgi:hypothetical protein